MEEPVGVKAGKSSSRLGTGSAKPVTLEEIESSETERISSGMEELDRVLGGGIVPGSLVLVGGDPGIGKSTILLQVCKNLSDAGVSTLYVSGEESLRQIKMRAGRIGQFSKDVKFLCETNLGEIEGTITKETAAAVIDATDTVILVYCRSGNRSKTASKALADLGYSNVYEFGGINTWPYEVE